MLAIRYVPLVVKQVLRHRTRTLLTLLGVGSAMFLFSAVQALQHGVSEATQTTSKDTTLVVYRQNRFCPYTSRLPEGYERRISAITGVAAVVPMKIVVNNCQASLDTVTFRGVPHEEFKKMAGRFVLLSGSLEEWERRGDAALIGETLATRRRAKVGESMAAAGITVYVAGIIRSDEPQDQNVAYVSLPFLQRSAARGGDGIVTQFNVKVNDPAQLEHVAKAIDAEFAHDQDPTDTRPEKAFVARAAHDLVQIVGFTKYLGWAALAAVLALIANAIVLAAQSRISEHAVLQTLGYRTGLIARLILAEGALLGLAGGVVGSAAAFGALLWGGFSMSVEGTSVIIKPTLTMLALAFGMSAGVGIVAGLAPAWQAARREIATTLRAV